ncbi:hypothetical protein H5410_026062 [Solanum commersonii]|uniref:Uncharacterized protein n=1 Tax=Solanum commersonii TaxID=4109 RepID=A0A9J5YVZ6_SOLCO|nr:hypothetical protein H5410_026062 [Solanum commersonii]
MSSAAGSAQLNTNLSNIENQRRHSMETSTHDLSRLFLHFSSYLLHSTHIATSEDSLLLTPN